MSSLVAAVWAVATVLGGTAASLTAQQGESSLRSTLAARKLVLPTTDALVMSGAKVAIETAAEVLGMVRGPQRTTTSVNTVEVVASGTMAERATDGTWRDYTVTRLAEGVDFVIPAARVDVERNGPTGRQRQIQVVAGQRAWDEEKPGMNGTSMEGVAADRTRMIWLTPQGAMWAALRAVEQGANVQLANERDRLAITYSLNGEPIRMVFNSDLLPESVQIQARSAVYGEALLEARHSMYKDFAGTALAPEGFLAPCPSRIRYVVAGRTIRDLTVSDCEINAYVIFPLPANMAGAQSRK